MGDTYVIVHGAWHTGAEVEPAAEHLRKLGHVVHCPTLAGNRPGDDRSTTGLQQAAESLCDYIEKHELRGIRLVAHSWGGMVISQAAERLKERLARLVYVSAYVPEPGECMMDMVSPLHGQAFKEMAAANNGTLMLPFPVWRETFINDADLALATSAYEKLVPQSYKSFVDTVELPCPMAANETPKSYVNCRLDTTMAYDMPLHPRISTRLGLFRLIECEGSHEVWLTDPAAMAAAIVKAGRD